MLIVTVFAGPRVIFDVNLLMFLPQDHVFVKNISHIIKRHFLTNPKFTQDPLHKLLKDKLSKLTVN
jgi:hypothetical protein